MTDLTITGAPAATPSTEGAVRHRRPSPNGFSQWSALTSRYSRAMLTNGELLTAMLAPLVFTLGFYLPLRSIMDSTGVDYARFIMPVIVLQAMSFTAVSAAVRASHESVSGMNNRLKTMPVAPLAPLAGRMSASFIRAVLSVVFALLFGHLIGFRFDGGLPAAVLFCAMAIGIAIVLSIGADALGTLSRSPEATSQILTLPQLILGMLSTGYIPESGFPEWIRPFVRNQPVSHFCDVMRSLAEKGTAGDALGPAFAWIIGLAVFFIGLSAYANLRRD